MCVLMVYEVRRRGVLLRLHLHPPLTSEYNLCFERRAGNTVKNTVKNTEKNTVVKNTVVNNTVEKNTVT